MLSGFLKKKNGSMARLAVKCGFPESHEGPLGPVLLPPQERATWIAEQHGLGP